MGKGILDFYKSGDKLFISQFDMDSDKYSQVILNTNDTSELYSYIVKHYINDIFLKELDKQE